MPCPSGSYSLGNDSICLLCPAGYRLDYRTLVGFSFGGKDEEEGEGVAYID